MSRDLVSVVIPTWNRHEELLETIKHIRQQTYKSVEIIVVIDGQDTDLANNINDAYYVQYQFGDDNVKLVELGRNWSGLMPKSFGIAPLLVGYLMATGKYIMPWCDDERALTKFHIKYLVNAMNTPLGMDKEGNTIYPDFVYPQVEIWRNGDRDGPETRVIGKETPEENQITHYMFRPETLLKYGMLDWNTHPVDWHLVEKWMSNGAKWLFTHDLTFTHRLDQ